MTADTAALSSQREDIAYPVRVPLALAGLVLLLLGILGLILSLLYTFMWSDTAQRRRRDYADYDAQTRNIPPRERERY